MGDDTQHDKLLDRVRKLLAKAEAEGVTPEEAEALNDKAAELIAKYGIDRARLAAEKPETDQIILKTIRIASAFSLDKTEMLWAICDPFRIECVRTKMRGTRDDGRVGTLFEMEMVGWKSDIERAELLFTSLLLQSAHELARVRIPRGEDVAAYRRSWLAGFNLVVWTRLTEAEAAATKQADTEQPAGTAGKSMELVLVDRSLAVKQAAQRQFGDVRQAKARTLNGSGLADGADAGRRANLHTNSSVGRRTAGALR